MNFGAHVAGLIKDVNSALEKDKEALVDDFVALLARAKSLFKTDLFDFWLSQLAETPCSELPITHYGVANARRMLSYFDKRKRDTVAWLIADICENLFTYSNNDDACRMQSDFHYYFNVSAGAVFKESKLGEVQGCAPESRADRRIARVSDLSIPPQELIP
ncbi:hypothetical protein ONV78_28275 [Hahella sp. CR1]|uniref:hypothetical protein n=1 Tax=Hahella sp. CR1 TaxID=2992807 RepID=UPI002441E48B|nr:hypothetical protein [Hahella sp. CR1]MDG9671666.1 hypothetical protein [Hahella sp. CR1]